MRSDTKELLCSILTIVALVVGIPLGMHYGLDAIGDAMHKMYTQQDTPGWNVVIDNALGQPRPYLDLTPERDYVLVQRLPGNLAVVREVVPTADIWYLVSDAPADIIPNKPFVKYGPYI